MMNLYTNIVVGYELGLEMLTLNNVEIINTLGINETELNIVDKLVVGSYTESDNLVPSGLLN